MAMTDPLGDMLTRIRNGQQAKFSSVRAPASKIRSNVLDVLQREGYIRGYNKHELRPGIAELEIELKYAEGEPAIREIARVSKPGLFEDPGITPFLQRVGYHDPVDAPGRHVGSGGTRRERRRRGALSRLLGERSCPA